MGYNGFGAGAVGLSKIPLSTPTKLYLEINVIFFARRKNSLIRELVEGQAGKLSAGNPDRDREGNA